MTTGKPSEKQIAASAPLPPDELDDTLNAAERSTGAFSSYSSKTLFSNEESFKGIIMPTDEWWVWAERFVMLTIVMTCIIEPFDAVFDKTLILLDPSNHSSATSHIFGWILDVIFVLYISQKFRVTYKRAVAYESDKRTIRRRYLWDDFVVDLISVIPTDLFMFAWADPMDQAVAQGILRLNRLVRLYPLSRYLLYREHSHEAENNIKYSQYIVLVAISSHWLACGWYALACFDGCLTTSAIAVTWASTAPTAFLPLSGAARYLLALYWAVYSTTGVGYGHLYGRRVLEEIYSICSMLTGNLVYSFCTGSITSMLVNRRARKLRFQQKVHAVNKYMRQRRLEEDWQERVLDSYEYGWIRNRGVNVQRLIDEMPTAFRAEISVEINETILEKVPLFAGAPITFIRTVANALHPLNLLPGDYVVHKGDMGQEMFFIAHGSVDVVSEDGTKVFASMHDGAFFGELALLKKMPRTASIRASCHCDLYYLTKEDLDDILKYFPDVAERVHKEAEERFQAHLARSGK